MSILAQTDKINKSSAPEAHTIPENYAEDAGHLLFQWLGTFWTQVCEDRELALSLAKANGVLSAQLYQKFQETLNFTDRTKLNVYSKKLWYMLSFKESDRNDVGGITVGLSDLVVGGQTHKSFIPDAVATVNGIAPYQGVTMYPLPENIHSIAAITNQIIDPTVILLNGVDFYVEEGKLCFLNDNDPLKSGKFTLMPDNSVKLWCMDTLIDDNYVFNYAGYALGIKAKNSKMYLDIVNALWDLYSDSATIDLLKVYLGAVLDEPVIKASKETVIDIIYHDDYEEVVTNKHTYTTHKYSKLLPNIIQGAKLSRGDFLTDTIKLYENLDTSKLQVEDITSQFYDDIPALFLPAPFFRASLEHGVGITWELSDIETAGKDKHGHEKYLFRVYGDDADVQKLWQDIWDHCEENEIDQTSIYKQFVMPEGLNEEVIGTKIRPLDFFMYNFLKAHAFALRINVGQLSDAAKKHIHLVSELKKVLPAHSYMFVIERISGIIDGYDLESIESTIVPSVASACKDIAKEGASPSTMMLTYGDTITRFVLVPVCK